MYKFIIKKLDNKIEFISEEFYTTELEAFKSGMDFIDTWEAINNTMGKVEVING